MRKQRRSTPKATIKWRLFLIPLAYVAFFTAYRTWFHQWTIRVPDHLEVAAVTRGQDSLKGLLGRLLGGDDRITLETTRFVCENAPYLVFCVANQQVRIETANLKAYIRSYNENNTLVHPYPIEYKGITSFLIRPVHILKENIIESHEFCRHYAHEVPVIVFSSGMVGNIFHEINEIIIPLFLTSRHFHSRVQFMVTDYRPSFVQKYNRVFAQLSSYRVIGTGTKTGTHCFPGAVFGIKYHDYLTLDPDSIPEGYTLQDFKQFLREAYSLKFKNADEIKKPVLLLISRKESRTFINENEMVQMMKNMGFQVVIRNKKDMLNLDIYSRVVNSCNVMVGAHGAGLTNMIFLPQGAVYIQVVPYALTWAANTYYGKEPASKLGLRYLEYNIAVEESSLIRSYGSKHAVITDPGSISSKGYQAVRSIYLDGQNMTIDLPAFRETLVEALHHLGHRYPPNVKI